MRKSGENKPLPEQPKLLAQGLSWPESPRWRDGILYISDVHNFRIARVHADGSVDTLCKVDGRPAGMDFAADGSLLLATGVGRELMRIDPGTGEMDRLASLGERAKAYLNDLVTHPNGWSWFGDTGFRFGIDEPVANGSLWGFHADHGLKQVASEIFFPNGLVVSPDGAVLYVAETFGKRITAFDIAADGTLGDRRLHASLPAEPDGLCLDAEGCLWVPLLFQGDFIRIAPDGSEIARLHFPGMNAIACIAAGPDRRALFLCVSAVDRSDPERLIRNGAVYMLEAPAAGAGYP
jgi:sugar lactone lactonase YvrE